MSLRFSLLAGAALIASPLASAQSVTADGPAPNPSAATSFGGQILFDQSDDFGGGIVSQTNIDTPTFDTINADDFDVPVGESWVVTNVVAQGFYSQNTTEEAEPQCTTADIGFWTDGDDEPDTPLFFYEDTDVASDDGTGLLSFDIEETPLLGGTYWLSISCKGELNFDTSDADGDPIDIRRWNWNRNNDNDADNGIGGPAVLRNDGGAFGIPEGWNPLADIGITEGFDLNFVLSGLISTASEAGPAGASVSIGNAVPNPSTTSARVPFSLQQATDVQMSVYDVLGRQVATIADGARSAGNHEATLNVSDLAPGTYVVRLMAGPTVVTRTISVAR